MVKFRIKVILKTRHCIVNVFSFFDKKHFDVGDVGMGLGHFVDVLLVR